jgi:LPS-assembly protein
MTFLRHTLATLFLMLCLVPALRAQDAAWIVESLTQQGQLDMDIKTGTICGTNGVVVKYSGVVLTADRVCVSQQSGDCAADGRVRIQRDDQVWTGEHITYNFRTHQMQSEQFRTGKSPVYAEGEHLRGDMTNNVYTASHAYITSDDVFEPGQRVRASTIRIVPGKYFEAYNAVVYAGKVPVFYFPYYHRRLDQHSNRFHFTPGYRSHYGGFLLGSYTFYVNEQFDGALHLDYRSERGVGTGADANLHLQQWGEAEFKYYYTHDLKPGEDATGQNIPSDRQRFYFGYSAMPATNFFVKSRVSYQSDSDMLKDFFEGEYNANPQASTFVDLNKVWPNFSLDLFTMPRVNDFNETVERLPEAKLSAYRQQLASTPVYYQSESTLGWYRRQYSDTNSPAIPDYSAWRGDSFHQFTLPFTLFNWLNIAPRTGGRFTYYGNSTATNTTSDSISRGIFNTGMNVDFKASRVWSDSQNKFLDVNGVRHIVQPSVDYAFVSRCGDTPSKLPQFDYQMPTLRLLPIDFPDYNDVDSIDNQNTVRFRLLNKLQTKRGGKSDNLVWWDVYTDWHAVQYDGQDTFSDLFSDLAFKPRSWLTLESLTEWNMQGGDLDFSFNKLTIQPNNTWSWGLGHWYTRDGFVDDGSSLLSSTMFWRMNENWGFRVGDYYDIRGNRLQQQTYSIYRDLRSWTAAVTFRVRNESGSAADYAVALTFSFKAAPRFPLGSDTVNVEQMLGN